MAITRDSLETLLATLETEHGKPGKSLLPLLDGMSRFPHYSLSHQLLILAQRPDASRGTADTLDVSLERIRATATEPGAGLEAISFEAPDIPARCPARPGLRGS